MNPLILVVNQFIIVTNQFTRVTNGFLQVMNCITPVTSNQLQVSNQIQNIQQEISRLQSLLGMANSGSMLGNKYSCAVIVKNLYFGIANDPQVYCLQEFLTDQGAVIYPEARITGNFYQMTKAAVIRFQEKHQSDILTPFGLTQGNGFVGLKTRQAINQLIGN